MVNIMNVAMKQNATNWMFISFNMEVVAISLNSSTGRDTLNTYLFATSANSSVISPMRFRNHPNKITKNIGNVALILKIKLLMIPVLYLLCLWLSYIFLSQLSYCVKKTCTWIDTILSKNVKEKPELILSLIKMSKKKSDRFLLINSLIY